MATVDDRDSRRKHRRSSSPADVDRSSKLHRHRHESRRPDEECERDCETVPAVPSPTLPRNSARNHRVLDDDDVEEGEILEEDDGNVSKQHAQSDAETGDQDARSDNAILGHFVKGTFHAKDLKTRRKCNIDDEFISPDGQRNHVDCGIHEDDGFCMYSRDDLQHGKVGRDSTDGMGNGLLDYKFSKGDKRHSGKGNGKLKCYRDDGDVEVGRGKVGNYRNSSSESGEKHRRSRHLNSPDRYRSRSRSSGYTRDRSRSGSMVEDYAHSKRKHSGEQGDLSYSRLNTDYDLDDERMTASRRENRDLVVDKGREHRSGYHIQEAWGRDRIRDRDVDMDLKMEKESERIRNREEVNWMHRREKEHENSHERHRRDVEKGRKRERLDDRDRRREKERGDDRDIRREKEREDDRDRRRERERGDDRDIRREKEREDDRDRRREKERDRSCDTVFERDRRRDKEKRTK